MKSASTMFNWLGSREDILQLQKSQLL